MKSIREISVIKLPSRETDILLNIISDSRSEYSICGLVISSDRLVPRGKNHEVNGRPSNKSSIARRGLTLRSR